MVVEARYLTRVDFLMRHEGRGVVNSKEIIMEDAVKSPSLERPRDAFARLGISSTTGWKLVRLGFLKTVKIGRATRITAESIDQVIESGVRFSREDCSDE